MGADRVRYPKRRGNKPRVPPTAVLTKPRGQRAPGGIQALDVALAALRAFAAFDRPATLTELAREADMPPSKLHRYLASFIHAGLAIQREKSGRYDLGPVATELGLLAISRSDIVNECADGLEALVTKTGLTALLSVWGAQGATVIRWQRAPNPLVTSFGLGSTLPLLRTAGGRVFLAFLPRRITRAKLEAELADVRGGASPPLEFDPTEERVAQLIEEVRGSRVAMVDGRFIPGLAAIAAPVTNWQEEAELVVTLVGAAGEHLGTGGAAHAALIDFVDRRSLRLRRSGSPGLD